MLNIVNLNVQYFLKIYFFCTWHFGIGEVTEIIYQSLLKIDFDMDYIKLIG